MQLAIVSFAAPVRSLHAGRRLRTGAARTRSVRGAAVDVPAAPLPHHVITNSRVVGDELLQAVAFLSDALNLPALNPDAERTAKCIDLNALRRAAA